MQKNIKKEIVIIGALTSKPYSFSGRPWELDRVSFIDFFDSLGSEIYVEFSGLTINRILPKISDNINGEWITDRIRFFYDSLTTQKILNCWLKINKVYTIISWYVVFYYLRCISIFFFKHKRLSNVLLNYYSDITLDLSGLFSVEKISYLFTSYNIYNYTYVDNKFLNIDIINSYFLPFNLDYELSLYEYLYLIGYNIRCEHPILFFKLLTLINKKKLKIVVFGVPFLYNIHLTHCGISFMDFYNYFYKVKALYNNSLFFLGSSLLNRYDFNFFKSFFDRIKFHVACYTTINIKVYYLFYNIGTLNLLYSGLKSDFRDNFSFSNIQVNNFKTLFQLSFYENDYFYNSSVINRTNFPLNLNVFLGSNGFVNDFMFDLCLPIPFMFEKENLLLNLTAKITSLKFIYAPSKHSKNFSQLSNIYMFFLERNILRSIKNRFGTFILFKFVVFKKFTTHKKLYSMNQISFDLSENLTIFGLNLVSFVSTFAFNNIINNFYITNIYSLLSANLVLAFMRSRYIYIYNNYEKLF